MRAVILVLLLFLSSPYLLALEVDNFSTDQKKLTDVDTKIDDFVNLQIEKALDEVNQERLTCYQAKERLILFLQKRLTKAVVSPVEFFVTYNPAIDKVNPPLSETVYYNFKFFTKSPTLFKFINSLAPVIQIKGIKIGTDKLSHFFTEGLDSFIHEERLNYSATGLKKLWIYKEKSIWGLLSSGIFSYADIFANYQGLLFWRTLFGKDFLKKRSPYADHEGVTTPSLTCEKGYWKQFKKFRIADYIHDGFNEAINCSTFRDQETYEHFQEGLLRLSVDCPLERTRCIDLAKVYGDAAEDIVSPVCRELFKYGEIKNREQLFIVDSPKIKRIPVLESGFWGDSFHLVINLMDGIAYVWSFFK